ncbi:hypothetical protein FBU59_002981 [Linderina macrospora]|uniref:Uncharacterized protein n=1 Tax=Linderina macrospora TaxID=4868 RepID=A0ACC1J9I5_9FUNG|nr:hypothetical protein FBU59_002981 [Linderina macrospora]
MATASTAWAVPDHILESIFGYATGLGRKANEYSDCGRNMSMQSLMSMLWVNQYWRLVVQPLFFRNAVVFKSDARFDWRMGGQFRLNLREVAVLGAEDLVQSVELRYELYYLLNEQTQTDPLYQRWLENTQFKGTRQLVFCCDYFEVTEYMYVDILARRAAEYSQRLDELFPNLQSKAFRQFYYPSFDSAKSSRIVGAMCGRTRRISLDNDWLKIEPRILPPITKLTYTLADNTPPDDFFAYLYKIAPTLEFLSLRDPRSLVWTRVVQRADGSPIVYPRLQTLHINCYYVVSHWQHRPNHTEDVVVPIGPRSAPAGVPFPVLQEVGCKPAYPFANDIVFRGNNAVLKRAGFLLDITSFRVLEGAGVFDSHMFPAMANIKLGDSRRASQHPQRVVERLLTRAFCVAPTASTAFVRLDLSRPVPGDATLVAALSSASVHLQNLVLPDVTLGLQHAIQVLQVLPNLRRLTLALGSEAGDELAIVGALEGGALRTRVSSLTFMLDGIRSPELAAEHIRVLAAVIGTLRLVTVSGPQMAEVAAKIREVPARPEFAELASRLANITVCSRRLNITNFPF